MVFNHGKSFIGSLTLQVLSGPSKISHEKQIDKLNKIR
ncbi:hypothetical protein ADICYQ_4700 [Cyclobacterium qasimii M12-11B]|uniref:Uncharacterized protein n=1 Tax=Cyclobacterium qasimii M12-11B TaxID=641524 RepID=S7V9R0_9BACT|nr:hypothetical protein ADICYQ_4700 [Cyclobacterium qasimii M12-11B]